MEGCRYTDTEAAESGRWIFFSTASVFVRSTGTRSKTLAQKIEDKRRRDLEEGAAGVRKRQQPLLFSVAAKEWLELKIADWSSGTEGNSYRIENWNLEHHLLPCFGRKLLCDIDGDAVNRYKGDRLREGAKEKTVHLELGTLRSILRWKRLWGTIQPDVKMPRGDGEDIGRPLTGDEEHRLLTAAKSSRSRALYPAILISIHTGVRFVELSHLQWLNVDLIARSLRVGRSKGKAGVGRVIPLSDEAHACLVEWRKKFPDAQPSHYVFCCERYGLDGEDGRRSGKVTPYKVEPTKPVKSFKFAWNKAREVSNVACRWHDMRHTFVSRLAENGATDTEIMAMSGHLTKKMLERYSHARNNRKRAAIDAAFGRKTSITSTPPHGGIVGDRHANTNEIPAGSPVFSPVSEEASESERPN